MEAGFRRGYIGSGLALLLCVVVVACQSSPDRDGHREIERIGAQAGQAVERQASQHIGDGDDEAPKRIIFFIGDGMGLSGPTAASYVAGRPLAMVQMQEFGMMSTHSYEFVTTDSAASATAMATGEKTHFEGVSVTPTTGPDEEREENHQLRNIVDAAQQAGWRTGLTTTVRITHATPAPFAAHRHHRRQYDDIAADISESGVDLLLGPGYQYFRDRDDDRQLMTEMQAEGYEVTDDADRIREVVGRVSRLVGLVHGRDMPWVDEGKRAMELAEMVDHSIQTLDRGDPEGFFLMVEGSKIDWAGHAMDGRRFVEETLDMDRAVGQALKYARDRSDTLVVVSSDHETGAMDVIDGPTAQAYLDELGSGDRDVRNQTIPEEIGGDQRHELRGPFTRLTRQYGDFGPTEDASGNEVIPSFGYLSAASRAHWDGDGRFSAAHTPELVPLFADGPGAGQVAGIRDNADLGRQFLAWIDGEDPDVQRARRLEERAGDEEPKNVVLLVADGLGMGSLSASYYHRGPSAMLSMPQAAAVATHAENRLVNDAAGAATALSTGARTRRGTLGMGVGEQGDLEERSAALEQALGAGRNTGIVTTGSLFDRSPGAFFARQHTYGQPEEIAGQFAALNREVGAIDFVAGAGVDELGGDHLEILEQSGAHIHDRWDTGPEEGANHYIFDSPQRTPTIAEMTARGLEELSGGDEGFLLIVDSADIARAKSQFDGGERLMNSISAYDEAVGEAIDFAADDGQTLVMATSLRDHTLSVIDNHYAFRDEGQRCGAAAGCGGEFAFQWLDVAADQIRHGHGFDDQSLQGRDFSPPQIAVQYTWMAQQAAQTAEVDAPHSANFVPLFADGPGARAFAGFMDQPEVGRWLVDWAMSPKIDER